MGDREKKGLQNPRTWDWSRAETRPGGKKPRAVVSVAFSRDDFENVALCAERWHMKVSEFIRSAAVGCAEARYLVVSPSASSPGAGSVVTVFPPPSPTDAPEFDKDEYEYAGAVIPH